MNTYIDVHVLQTVPPSNVNRDDTGSPKTAKFGGVTRARVSSQAWKRATRRDFSANLDDAELGERTLFVAERIARLIGERNPELAENALDLAIKVLKAADIKVEVDKPKATRGDDQILHARTGYLVFLSRAQIAALADLAAGQPDGKYAKKDAQRAIRESPSLDVCLFGRMIAEAPDLNVDASAQVAHALSVHSVENEFDYFTAVDDNADEDNAGAGMIGTVEFNSSTLYRYATVNAAQLANQLGSAAAAAKAVESFVRSFVTSMPTGKQNTFANRTRPDFVLLAVRGDQPVNLVGAFEDPIDSVQGRMSQAVTKLMAYGRGLDEAYGTEPVVLCALAAGGAATGDTADALADVERVNLDALVSAAGAEVRERTDG